MTDTAAFDLTIRNGRISTAADTFHADIGVRDGVVVALGQGLPPGARDIDAAGRWVLPGGIDSHCHVEQLSGMGIMCADDFYSATVSAAFGGTTTIIPFAAQHRGNALPEVVADYARRAEEKAVIDYGFHLILSDPTEQALKHDLPALIKNGITSFKVFMTYDRLKLDDYQLLDVLEVADREGALVMVHAENNDMIRWVARRLAERGMTAPKYHAVAHTPLAESEATNRAVTLARMMDVPILIVHVAGLEAVRVVHSSQALGLPIHAESCPQYLFLTADDIDAPGLEGAKFCCSPPPRDAASQEAVWQGLADGTLQIYSSDHAPYRFDASGKLPKGEATTFKDVANGVPGLEVRMPLLFSEGVLGGRISIERFVALTASNHARTYGLYPQKGTIAVGADADIAIWNPEREVTISASMLHDNVGYTPYEGRTVRGWPEVVISRGRIAVQDGQLHVARGSGRFIKRGTPEPVLRQRLTGNPNALVRKYFSADSAA
ncbi:dihydropyrimidinase [Achromobacter mucicolens]|uniref:dihydropyrimidinase n=1 Tax=Achromobacter mucicolens TaxID=1389922 RepID=UPI0021CF2A99|nr:dihydropyrimidinase [Achromobacter mucicolens]MCU6615479.1 dihydropyrimidinase [Achromobacter mucicolens]